MCGGTYNTEDCYELAFAQKKSDRVSSTLIYWMQLSPSRLRSCLCCQEKSIRFRITVYIAVYIIQ